jgi:hypothetical protein
VFDTVQECIYNIYKASFSPGLHSINAIYRSVTQCYVTVSRIRYQPSSPTAYGDVWLVVPGSINVLGIQSSWIKCFPKMRMWQNSTIAFVLSVNKRWWDTGKCFLLTKFGPTISGATWFHFNYYFACACCTLICCTSSGTHQGYQMGTGALSPEVRRPEREVDYSDCQGQERVDLYIHSPYAYMV